MYEKDMGYDEVSFRDILTMHPRVFVPEVLHKLLRHAPPDHTTGMNSFHLIHDAIHSVDAKSICLEVKPRPSQMSPVPPFKFHPLLVEFSNRVPNGNRAKAKCDAPADFNKICSDLNRFPGAEPFDLTGLCANLSYYVLCTTSPVTCESRNNPSSVCSKCARVPGSQRRG